MPLERDTFWDRGTTLGASNLNPAEYHDPSEEVLLASKTTMAAQLPPGIWGARGTIIKGSTLGGAPLGFDPNGVAVRINVDPDIPGQGFVIDPTRITEAMAAAACDQAGVRQAQTLEDLRFRAAEAMQAFAISRQPDIIPNSTARPREAPVAMPGVYVVPAASSGGGQLQQQQAQPTHISQGVQTKTAETSTNMTKYTHIPGFAPDNPQTPQVARPPEPPVARTEMQVSQKPSSLFAQTAPPVVPERRETIVTESVRVPTYKVTLEVKGSPVSIEAWYHEVVRNEQVLVLCYDTRTVGFPRTRLRPQSDDIAVHVDGAAVFYICTDPGISFTHQNDELQVFLIKAEHPYQAENAVPQMPALM